MTTEPKLPQKPSSCGATRINGQLQRAFAEEPMDEWGLQCFEAGRQQGIAESEKDAERYRWLRFEHGVCNPLAHVSWKRNGDRTESDWVNTIGPEWLDKAIDAAIEDETP